MIRDKKAYKIEGFANFECEEDILSDEIRVVYSRCHECPPTSHSCIRCPFAKEHIVLLSARTQAAKYACCEFFSELFYSLLPNTPHWLQLCQLRGNGTWLETATFKE